MTAVDWVIVGALSALATSFLFVAAAVFSLRKSPVEIAPDPDDRALAQQVLADSFTRLTEVAEGQKNRMVAAGWSEFAAEAVSAHTLMRLIDSATGITKT